jgi:hypothetical protein
MQNVAPSAEGSLLHIIHTEITIISKIIKNVSAVIFHPQTATSRKVFLKTKAY